MRRGRDVSDAVSRPIEREYRSVLNDNLRWNRFVVATGRHLRVHAARSAARRGCRRSSPVVDRSRRATRPGPVMERRAVDRRRGSIRSTKSSPAWTRKRFRRSVKTHTNADGIPWYPFASYIVVSRDGRDVFMSYVNHMRNLRLEVFGDLAASAVADGIDVAAGRGFPPLDDIHEFFAWWLESETAGSAIIDVVLGASREQCNVLVRALRRPEGRPRRSDATRRGVPRHRGRRRDVAAIKSSAARSRR